MIISVIIPALNEEDFIADTLQDCTTLSGNFEFIVADGGSTDHTRMLVEKFSEVRLISSEKGRANQMNAGAASAQGDVLLFLHADTFLPQKTYKLIKAQLEKEEYVGGSFRLRLDLDHFLLNCYSWCSRFSIELFTYGDHAMFMRRDVFERIGGFRKMPFLEDIEIQKRLRSVGKFRKLKAAVTTSARRFRKMGTAKQLGIDALILFLYNVGVSPQRLKKLYKDHGS